jgi:hypothetical protein
MLVRSASVRETILTSRRFLAAKVECLEDGRLTRAHEEEIEDLACGEFPSSLGVAG